MEFVGLRSLEEHLYLRLVEDRELLPRRLGLVTPPGDAWGHWDTAASLSPTPHRQWDRHVHVWLDAHFARPVRRVTSLEECNPREKAWLVLLDHIGRMVGQAQTLHAATERYQAAVYQRQAAQRLVAQIEEYGGAMLCDGVGLGKTYVATTVVVHYANAWREQLAAAGQSAADDPFRVTVLSPNSVVSTWQREALPPLAAHGVPLATIRVISHAKLSRVRPNSDVLTAGRSGMSDMESTALYRASVIGPWGYASETIGSHGAETRHAPVEDRFVAPRRAHPRARLG